jgi:hypothetical protein
MMTFQRIFTTNIFKQNETKKRAFIEIMIFNQEDFLIYWMEKLYSFLQPVTLSKTGDERLTCQAENLFKTFMMVFYNKQTLFKESEIQEANISLEKVIDDLTCFHMAQDIPLRETMQFILSFKDSFFQYFYKSLDDISLQQVCSDMIRISQITDRLILIATESGSKAQEQIFLRHLNQIRQNIENNLKIIPKIIQRLERVQIKTEKETLNVISALQNIVQKSKEGSEEADAVVAYFMGDTEKKDAYFGRSYISYMIQENESALRKVGAAFQMIGTINNEISDNLKNISSKVQSIQNFVEQIDRIASQSKLLSVNSSIEAARAGEQGRRFGVVADEIRNLANISAQSVAHIREIAEESKAAMNLLQKNIDKQLSEGTAEMETAEKNLRETFERFKYSIDNISEAIKVLTISYQAISKEIENATVALQFQDMISQEIVSINSSISSFNRRFEKLYQEKGMTKGGMEKENGYEDEKEVSHLRENYGNDVEFF